MQQTKIPSTDKFIMAINCVVKGTASVFQGICLKNVDAYKNGVETDQPPKRAKRAAGGFLLKTRLAVCNGGYCCAIRV